MRSGNIDGMGIRLIKKGKKGIAHILFSRMGLFLFLMVLQAVFLCSIFFWFEGLWFHAYSGMVVFSLLMVLYLLNSRINPTAKITWLIIMMLMPVFGALLYWYTQRDIGHRALKARFGQIVDMTREAIPQPEGPARALAAEDPGAASLAHYIARSSCHPVFDQTEVTYFSLGEEKFEEMLRQLEGAEHFIFLEYFIINEGLMWGKVLEILARKAREGVEVRLLYDGTCELALLPHNYPKLLKELGIQCKVFAPVSPFISTHYNYRDHRKILVIDGHTAFNGGVNLADEYINGKVRFGHWKDAGIMVKGEAVERFTHMFLEMWNESEKKAEDYERYLTPDQGQGPGDGYVIPYSVCPLGPERVGERVYLDIIHMAHSYVHIMTPYLILDYQMQMALSYAAKRGVEVVIIMPRIPDKKYAFVLAKTYYNPLLEAGVRIFEYEPGFVHAKVFVSDDEKAVVGTVNLDFRSLYHHFECGLVLYRNSQVAQVERDVQDTLEKCIEIGLEDYKKLKLTDRMLGRVMRFVAPLM